MKNDKQALNLFKTYMVLGPQYQAYGTRKLVFPKSITHLIMQYAQYEDWMGTANDLAALLKRNELNFITQSEAWAQDESLNDAKKWLANPNQPLITGSYDFIDQSIMPLVHFLAKCPLVNVHSMPALFLAATYGHTQTLKALLAVPNIEVNTVVTALMGAACFGPIEAVKVFLEVPGIDVNAVDKNGKTALIYAAINDRAETLKALVMVPGIRLNAADKHGSTALMWAACLGHIESLKILLVVPGIDVNAVDDIGRTALMLAAGYGHPEAESLIEERLEQQATSNQNKPTIN